MANPEKNQAQANPTRRNILKIIGGGTIVAAVGAGVFAATRNPTKAIEPWRLAHGPEADIDPRRMVLSHAILAPNPHNRQPWMVDLVNDDEMVLYCDLDRRLPHTDPFDRQITVGLGCFLELASIAAKQIGMTAEIETFPLGGGFPRLDSRPVARIRLSSAPSEKDPLFAHVFDRRSNKELYDASRTVSAETANAIVVAAMHGTAVGSVLAPEHTARLRSIAWDAMNMELHTYRTAKESIDLLRIGKAEIEANPDGIDLGGVFFETMDMLGQMDREEMLDVDSFTFKQQVAAIAEPFGTANGFVFVKTSGNTRADQIAAGRDYVRLNLKATELGVAMQPWSQALQEFEEVRPMYNRLREELGVEGDETLQMFARIGYGEDQPPSPRWPYESRIRNA